MTPLTLATTGSWHHRLTQVIQLRQIRGNKRTLYALLRRILLLPVAGRVAKVYAGDLWELDLAGETTGQSTSPIRLPQSYQVRLADNRDLLELAAYYGREQIIRDRLNRGDLCFMTLCQGCIGAAVWLVHGPGECREDWEELQLWFRFPAGVAWTYDGKGTRLGAWGTLMRQLPDLLRELGVQNIATFIDCDNWQSQDAHRSLGYHKTGLISSARLLGFHGAACRQANRRWQLLPACIGSVEISP